MFIIKIIAIFVVFYKIAIILFINIKIFFMKLFTTLIQRIAALSVVLAMAIGANAAERTFATLADMNAATDLVDGDVVTIASVDSCEVDSNWFHWIRSIVGEHCIHLAMIPLYSKNCHLHFFVVYIVLAGSIGNIGNLDILVVAYLNVVGKIIVISLAFSVVGFIFFILTSCKSGCKHE